MSSYPVFESLLVQGTTDAEISLSIIFERSKEDKVDVATHLYEEMKLAEETGDVEIREQIAYILFNLIVYHALRKWLKNLLAGVEVTLTPQDVEDWIQGAVERIYAGHPSRRFLNWAFCIARWYWIDRLRRIQRAKNEQESGDFETLDEILADESINLEALAQWEDTQASLLRAIQEPDDIWVLKAVVAGIPWHNTADIAAWTRLSILAVTKSKERIKRIARRLGKGGLQ